MQGIAPITLDLSGFNTQTLLMKNCSLKLIWFLFLALCVSADIQPSYAQDREYEQREDAVKKNMELARRLKDAAVPVRVKLAENCGKRVTSLIGVEFATTDSVGAAYQKVMKNLYKTGLYPTITMIAKQSPADNKLKIGDMVTHVNGVKLEKGKGSLEEIKTYIGMAGKRDLKLTLTRSGQTKDVVVKPVMACDKPARISGDSRADVTIDERKIGVKKSLLRSSISNEKLAKKIEAAILKSLR